MQHHLCRNSLLFQCLKERNTLICLYIPVIDSMNNKNRCFDFIYQIQIITLIPETIIISGCTILCLDHFILSFCICFFDTFIVFRIFCTAETVFCKNIHVVSLPANSRKIQSSGTIICIPVGNGCFRNNCFESFYACSSHTDTHSAKIRFCSHCHVSCTPGCQNFNIVCLVGKCAASAIQPVNNCFECKYFFSGSGQCKSFRITGSETTTKNRRIASFIEVFICFTYTFKFRFCINRSMLYASHRRALLKYSGCNFFLISLIIEADIFFFDILCRKSFHFTIYIVRHIPVFVTCQHIWICNINCRNFFAFLYFLRKSEIYGNQIFFSVAIGIYRCFNIHFFYDIRFLVHIIYQFPLLFFFSKISSRCIQKQHLKRALRSGIQNTVCILLHPDDHRSMNLLTESRRFPEGIRWLK